MTDFGSGITEWETFEMLCNETGPLVSPVISTHHALVPTEKTMAIALNKSSTCAEYPITSAGYPVN